MAGEIKIKTALISVYHKEYVESLIHKLSAIGVQFISTGGTKEYIEKLGYKVKAVEELSSFPSLFGGRVKTLHPSIMGGILFRRNNPEDLANVTTYNIPVIDLVVVDLYPFKQVVLSSDNEDEIIEKIDIGGVSLIRAAAKNYKDVVVVSSREDYSYLEDIIDKQDGIISLDQRRYLAKRAFQITSDYDRWIYYYFSSSPFVDMPMSPVISLRYGENPHQKGWYIGDLNNIIEKIQGQEISYNNLLDIDAGLHLLNEFEEPTIAILKHNNACGLASGEYDTLLLWKKALSGDPVSAFGGIIVTNIEINYELAKEIDTIFFEILIAKDYSKEATEYFKKKSKRIIIRKKEWIPTKYQIRSSLNGILIQERDLQKESELNFNIVTNSKPDEKQIEDLIFANKIVKHTKSNAIVIAKNKQLIGIGVGQTSRVDAVKQAIEKAQAMGFDTNDAVLASDAFFPFKDSIEIAHKNGIRTFIQPGGSIRDQESIDYCNENNLIMIFTGFRHFKH